MAQPDSFLPDLADSLGNLGGHLVELWRGDQALAATREARDIYRRLAAARPDVFLPDLARSLHILSDRLGNLNSREWWAVDIHLGRQEEAVAAAQEAADIYRRLAAARPDAFLPGLANSLNYLGAPLSALGQREDALAAAQEAVDIRRQLAAMRPNAFLPELAASLGTLGNFLTDLDRADQALAARQEAVATLAPFFLRWPARHGQWMSRMAQQYVESCEGLGAEPDAALLAPIAEAFEKLEGAEEGPDPNS
jgi:Tetratricopeptide repeat